MEQIDIKSLRIGNYLSFGLLYIVKVTAINPQQFIVEAKNSISGKDEIHDMISFKGDTASGNSRIEAFMPIPLTKEILLKCGFSTLDGVKETCIEKRMFTEVLQLTEDIYIGKDKSTGFYQFLFINIYQGSYGFTSMSAPIQYLHKLQNYYTSFSDKELEINL